MTSRSSDPPEVLKNDGCCGGLEAAHETENMERRLISCLTVFGIVTGSYAMAERVVAHRANGRTESGFISSTAPGYEAGPGRAQADGVSMRKPQAPGLSPEPSFLLPKSALCAAECGNRKRLVLSGARARERLGVQPRRWHCPRKWPGPRLPFSLFPSPETKGDGQRLLFLLIFG